MSGKFTTDCESRRMGALRLRLPVITGLLKAMEIIPKASRIEEVHIEQGHLVFVISHDKLPPVKLGKPLPELLFEVGSTEYLKIKKKKFKKGEDKINLRCKTRYDWEN